MALDKWYDGRVVLIGDAAHARNVGRKSCSGESRDSAFRHQTHPAIAVSVA
jgi:hypothetical protein